MTQQFTTTSDSITGLLPHTAYTIEVSPQTTAGIGPATTMTITTAEAAPVAVASVNSGGSTFNSLTVNWPAPMPPNGVITGYRVTWVP
uniref:Fibronectin type-III domain-containing protein n=1 Tax=Ciona savignyi TaxID=51511 RepID=H2ZPI3_CIOSA